MYIYQYIIYIYIYVVHIILYIYVQWNLPIADIPNSGHAMNSGQNIPSPKCDNLF